MRGKFFTPFLPKFGLKKSSVHDFSALGQKFKNLLGQFFFIRSKSILAKFQPIWPKNGRSNSNYFILRYGRFSEKWSKNDEIHNFSYENYKSWVPQLHNYMKLGQTQLLDKF